MSPRSDSGFSGLPILFSALDNKYEKSMSNLPKPCRWYGGNVKIHETL